MVLIHWKKYSRGHLAVSVICCRLRIKIVTVWGVWPIHPTHPSFFDSFVFLCLMWWYYLQLQQYSFLYLFIVIFYVNSLSVRLVGVSGSERPEVLFICLRGADKKGSALFMQTLAAGKKHSLPHLSPNMCIPDSFPARSFQYICFSQQLHCFQNLG